MGIFGGNKPMGYYTSQTAPREQLGLSMNVDPRMAGAATRGDKPGFFGAGGTGRTIAGVLGDFLANLGGQQGIYGQTMAHNRQQQQERQQSLQDYQMERSDKRADWQTQQQWDIDHPKPSTLQQNVDYAYGLPEGAQRQTAIQGIGGYGYSPEVMAAKQAAAEEMLRQRFANQSALKATPTYANLHPQSGGGGNTIKRLKPGQVVDGHTYVGGDPHNRASWR